MSENAQASGSDGWIELVIATLLSVAGLTTTWSSYQASLWDGEQAAHYSRANALRIMASSALLKADSRRAVEIGIFDSWLQAKARKEETLAAFYEDRFPADLKPAFDAWLAQKPLTNPAAPKTPFSSNLYRADGETRAAELDAQADAAYDTGQKDNGVSDVYTQATVFLAMSLFFGGIGQVFKIRRVRLALLAIGILACVAGITKVITLPTLSPG